MTSCKPGDILWSEKPAAAGVSRTTPNGMPLPEKRPGGLVTTIKYGFAALGAVFVVIAAGRSFLADGQPSVPMLRCGVLMMGIGVAAERLLPFESGKICPVCVGGVRAAPPVDCGGPWVYSVSP